MADNININKQLQASEAKVTIDALIPSLEKAVESVLNLNKAIQSNVDVNKKANDAQKAKKEALTETQKLAKQNIIIVNKIVAATSNEAKANVSLTQALANKKKEQREANKASVEAATAIRKAEIALKSQIKTVRDAEKQNAKLRIAVKNLDTTTEKGRATILKYNSAINSNSKFIDSNSDKQKKGFQNVGQYAQGIKSAAGQMLGFTSAGAGAVLILRKMITAFKEARADVILFEKEFTNVLTLLDEAQKNEFSGVLEAGAVKIMAEYGLSIEDVTKSLFDTISAGVPAGEAIEFLGEASKVAVAGNAELSSVIDGATTVLNAYGSKAGSTTDILNSFFAAQVKGKTTVGLLASNIGKVASTAAAADIPITELMSTFAGLTKFIGGTEDSATALANVINALIKPSDEAKATFEKLGIETGIAAIKQNKLLPTLLKVADAYEADNDVLTKLIPNIRAFKGIAGLTAEAVAELEQNTLDLNDAEASSLTVQKALEEQMSTRADQSARLKSATIALNIERDKTLTVLKKIGTTFREARIERKLYLAQKNREQQDADSLKTQVMAEIELVKEETGATIWYAEALERVLKAKEDIANVDGGVDLDDGLELPSGGGVDVNALKKQQEETKKITDEFLNAEKTKRKEAAKTSSEINSIIEEEESEFLRIYGMELDREDVLLNISLGRIETVADANTEANERLIEELTEIKSISESLNAQMLSDGVYTASTLLDNRVSAIDTELSALETKSETEEGLSTEEAARQKKLEKERRAEMIISYALSKGLAIADIIQNAARGIAIANATYLSNPLTAPLLPAVVAKMKISAAIQSAAILATDIPQFFKGTDSAPSGVAMVGEKGTEAVEKNGHVLFTPSTPTLMNLTGGERILTAEKTKQKYGDNPETVMYLRKIANKRSNGITKKEMASVMSQQSSRDYISNRLQGK